jgi:hypothetical protein
VVTIILEDIALYPALHGESMNYSWKFSEEEKNLPPTNYNSLRFLINGIEIEKEPFFKLEINQFFISKLNSYGRNNPFPISLEKFVAYDIRESIKGCFFNISFHQDNYHDLLNI